MAFKMRCPKCGSLDYSVERDNRTFGAVAQAFELVYHCRCGKQMFGEQLVKEYERQKKAYEAAASEADGDESINGASVGPLEEVAELRERLEHQRQSPEDRQREAAAAVVRQREEEDRRWRVRVQESAQDVVAAPSSAEGVGSEQECAWPGCTKPRRPNSKYCTRACSNKNARARHKARQKKSKKSKSAAA